MYIYLQMLCGQLLRKHYHIWMMNNCKMICNRMDENQYIQCTKDMPCKEIY